MINRIVDAGPGTPLQEIDPISDPRWSQLLSKHPAASVFHSPGWLDALRRTYGHAPAVLTTCHPDQELTNGLVFCRVRSWITGSRLVSLPFSDHCEPLVESQQTLLRLLEGLHQRAKSEGYKYAELRPVSMMPMGETTFHPSQSFFHHRLDLQPGTGEVYRRFHKDCIQRKIRRAGKEGLEITDGRDSHHLHHFHQLMLLTRRRHGLPPQPLEWFHNLLHCLGDAARIHLAGKDGQPIAGILTIQHGNTLVYKNGASDASFHPLGAMPFLFWQAIQDAISRGMRVLDLGRSDCDNVGLIAFKEHWGAVRSELCYWRSPAQAPKPIAEDARKLDLMRQLCTYIPDRCLTALGSLLHRHIA